MDYGFLGAAVSEWEIYGNPVVSYPSEVICDSQTPRLVPQMDMDIAVEKADGESLDLAGLLETAMENASAQTIRGTTAEELAGADFLAEDYDWTPDFDSRNVDVTEITDDSGNSWYGEALDLSQAGIYTVNYLTANSENANGETLYTFTVNGETGPIVDKSLLQAAYDYAAAQDTSKLIESVKAMYDQALANAEAVLANEDATEEEVWDAMDQLFEAVWSLGFVQGDKTNLGLLIERAEAMDEGKYVADNWQQLVDALAEAKAVYEDGGAMDEDIQPVAEALLNAILAQRYKADKSILEGLIHQANEIDTSLYTAESVQAFTAALKSANAVLADESLSEDEQATVDEAVATLSSAMDNLVETSADDNNSGDNTNTGDDANKGDDNTSDKDDTSSKDDPNKGPINKNPATGDNNLIALGALAVLLTSAGAFVVIRRKSRA